MLPATPFVLMSCLAGALVATSAAGAQGTWKFETIARSSTGNRKVALKVSPDGTVRIAYTGCSDGPCKNNELVLTERAAGGAWKSTVLDAANKDTGWFAALEADASGDLQIVYANHAKVRLSQATRDRTGTWSTSAIGPDLGGWWNSLALAPSTGLLWLANTSFPEKSFDYPALEIGFRSSSGWTFEKIDAGKDVGWFPSIATDSNGSPLVTYVTGGYPRGDLRLARRTSEGRWEKEWIDRWAVKSSMRVDSSGTVHVAYQQALDPALDHTNLYYATSNAPDSWKIERIDGNDDPGGETGHHPFLLLDGAGRPHVLYREMTKNCLMHARKDGDTWSLSCAGKRGNGGLYPTGQFDAAGRLHVAYDAGYEIVYGTCDGC